MAYRHDGRPQDLAVDPEEMLAAQRRSRNKRLVALGLVLVTIGAAGGAGAVIVARRTRAETDRAWSRAATCLVGEPLAAGESASSRVRNAQLVVMAVPPEKREAPGQEPWPSRCAAPVHAFAEAVKNGGGAASLAESAEKLGKAASGEANESADLGPLVDNLFAAAAADKLVAVRATDVPQPPQRAAPMTLATLHREARMFGGPLVLSSLYPAPFGDGSIRFVVDDKDFAKGPAACAMADGARAITCTKIPAPAAALSPALRPWGTTSPGVAPFVFAGDRGKSGIFRSDTGARVVDKLEYGAYGASALEDGSLGYLVWNDKPPETHFVRVAADGKRKESVVVGRKESGNPYYSSAIFWSHVAYKSVKKDADGIRLVVRDIQPDGALAPPVDVGRIDEVGQIEGGENEEPHLTACRSGETTVIRAKGWHNTFVSFFVAGKWTAPVEAPGLGGHLQCRSGEAIVSRVWGGPVGSTFKGGVDVRRCTVSGCEDRSVVLNKMLADSHDVLPREAKDVRAVDVDGKLLVVWSAGDRGGLRMRLAAPDQLAAAPDVVLYDDHIKDGAFREESTLVGFLLFPTAHGALLLLGTVDGVYAYMVDATGKTSPVATTI
jgi:hypothetical protein